MTDPIPEPALAGVEKLMTPEEVCDWFVISKDLLYDLVQQRRLPFIRVTSRQLRFRRSELEAYIADRHQEVEL